ncbi:MAG: polysaccharide deacetylase family protein [Alphaproteobacteria bacterium]|nr:polysaccharide deacetylase family protein [Alphaproteobacteria bacterium]
MKWPGDAKVALSVVVNVEEGAEGSILDGDKGMEPVDELGIFVKGPLRNFGNESNYQYGIKAGFPRVSKLLDKYDIKATWTTCALALERAPQIAAYIRDRGHEACSHGWRWQAQHRMDEVQEREYIRKAVTSIKKTTGTRPYGWLSRYLHTENTRRLLAEEGFTYHMDDFSDDVPFWEEVAGKPFVIMPYAVDSNDMKFWTDPALTPDQWLKYATDTFDWLYQEGAAGEPKVMSLGLHLRVIGRPGRIGAFEAFLKHVRARQGVWVATRLEMAQSFAEQHPSGAA